MFRSPGREHSDKGKVLNYISRRPYKRPTPLEVHGARPKLAFLALIGIITRFQRDR